MQINIKASERKNYTLICKPMTKKEFAQFVKNSEKSREMDFDKGIEIVEGRLSKHRKIK